MTWRSAGGTGLLVSLAALAVACATGRPTVSEVREQIGLRLQLGDPRSRIEEALAGAGVAFIYSDIGDRYQGYVPGSKRTVWMGAFPYKGKILVTVYLDGEECCARIEVEEHFTGL